VAKAYQEQVRRRDIGDRMKNWPSIENRHIRDMWLTGFDVRTSHDVAVKPVRVMD
jgi:hypothetical protein